MRLASNNNNDNNGSFLPAHAIKMQPHDNYYSILRRLIRSLVLAFCVTSLVEERFSGFALTGCGTSWIKFAGASPGSATSGSASLPTTYYNGGGPSSPSDTVHDHLCHEDDYTNDLPIFIEKRTICNFDTIPVPVYNIKITEPWAMEANYQLKFCLKGKLSQACSQLRRPQADLAMS